MKKLNLLLSLLAAINSCFFMASAQAAPPVLITSSFPKHDVSFIQCQQRAKFILEKMNLEIEDHGNGTIGGFGEQSVAIVNCHQLVDTLYVQIAVSSQKQEAAEAIMHYLVGYIRTASGESPIPGSGTKPPYQ